VLPSRLVSAPEAAAMRIDGHVIEFFELSEDSEVDVGAEGTFQIGQRCDFVVAQQRPQRIRRECERSHNVIVATEPSV
jgi:hypothetical protein